MSGRILTVVALAAVYLLTLRSAKPLDLVAGLVLGTVLVVALPGMPSRGAAAGGGVLGRLAASPAFAAALVALVARGTWDVALRALHLRPADQGGLVAVPIGDRTELGVAVTALVSTLSPGSVLVDVDPSGDAMLFHVVDARDPDAVIAAHQRFYDRYQRKVFP